METQKQKKKKWIKPTLIVIAIGIIITGLLYMIFYKGDAKPILSVANQFQPNASWHLQSNIVTPPMPTCFGAVKCPSVQRRWNSDAPITGTEFKRKLQEAGWSFPVTGDCDTIPLGGGSPSIMCTTKGRQGEYSIVVTLSGSTDNPLSRSVALLVE